MTIARRNRKIAAAVRHLRMSQNLLREAIDIDLELPSYEQMRFSYQVAKASDAARYAAEDIERAIEYEERNRTVAVRGAV